MADRVMSAEARITAKDATGGVLEAVGKKLTNIGKAAKSSKQVDELTAALKRAQAASEAIDRLQSTRATFADARTRFRAAQAAVEAAARANAQAEKPTRAMQAAYERAQGAVRRASAAFQEQAAAVTAAKRAVESYGVPIRKIASEQTRLRAEIDKGNAALRRNAELHERAAARQANRRETLGLLAAGAGVKAASTGRSLAEKAVVSSAEFDIATRKQREFTDIPKASQDKLLIPQAKRIGQETQFSNLDVVKAQTKTMQGLPSNITGAVKAEVAAGIMENVKNYALVMEADLSTSAEAIRSYLQQVGKDISTKEKALDESRKATNQLVKMAKLGGMSDEDVQQFLKFGAASGTSAGLTPETMMALGALARRGGLRGDEAGVFMRSASSKLVAPTKGGISALNAAGIDYSKFVKMPATLETSGLEGAFKQQLGLGLTETSKAALAKVMSDPKVVGDRGEFVKAVTEAVSGQFEKTKKGTLRPSDRVNIAKAAGTFHKLSAASVDTEGLLNAIMASKMTLAQLNEFFSDKQGGKAAITQRQREEYNSSRKALQDVGDDPDFAKHKADEIMAGVGGAFEQAKGALENFTASLGQANEGLIKFGADKFSDLLGSFDSLSKSGQQAATAIGALAAGGAGLYGAVKIAGGLAGGFGLSGSAAALTESAAALNVAAARLTAAGAADAGGGLLGTAGKTAAGAAAGAATVGAAGTALFAAAGIAAVAGATYLMDKYLPTGSSRLGKPLNPTPAAPAATTQGGAGHWMSTGRGSRRWVPDGGSPAANGGAASSGGGPVEAVVKPDQITAKITDPVEATVRPDQITAPLTGSAEVHGESKVAVVVTVQDGAVVKALANAKADTMKLMGQFKASMSGIGSGSSGPATSMPQYEGNK